MLGKEAGQSVTARELIKLLETCDLDMEVMVVVSVLSENDQSFAVVLKPIEQVFNQGGLIAIR